MKQPVELLAPSDLPRFAETNQRVIVETVSKDGKLIKATDVNNYNTFLEGNVYY